MTTRTKRFLLAILLAAAYLYPFPYFEEMRSANELPRVYLTMAMVDEGRFAIDTGAARWGHTVDMSPHGDHVYSNKAPGSSMLAIPAYVAVKGVSALMGTEPSLAVLTWSFRVATGVVPTLLFLLLLWHFLGRFAPSPATRRLLLVGYGLGSMALIYSILFIAHQLSAVFIGTAYILSVWVVEQQRREPRWLLAIGLAAGAAVLCDYQAAFAGVPVAVYLLWHLVGRAPRRWGAVLLAGLGAAIPIGVLLLYHWQAFGDPLRTGYDASEAFAHFHQRGFLGMDRLRAEAFVGSTLSMDNGLFVLCPMLLLAIPGWVLLARRRDWWHLGVTLSVAVIYLLFISSIVFWRGGWQVGPRYVTVMLPFLMVPIAVAVAAAERRWWQRGAVVGLIGVGVVVYASAAVTFPHWPEKFANPLYELVFRLLAEGHLPASFGSILGLGGTASVVPFFLLVGGLLGWAALPSRSHWRSAAVGAALCVLIVSLYGLAPGGGARAEQAYDWVVSVMPGDAG